MFRLRAPVTNMNLLPDGCPSLQANENSKLADSASEKLVVAVEKPADSKGDHGQQAHAPKPNEAVSHPADPSLAGLPADGSQGAAEGEVGVNGYHLHDSAPRRQPADVSTQCIAARRRCQDRQQVPAGMNYRKPQTGLPPCQIGYENRPGRRVREV